MATDNLADSIPYGYHVLNSPKEQIRLIRLSPQSNDGTIHCDLETHAFDDAPEYVALSYTWGPPTSLFKIYVNGRTFEIRKNLFQFLQQYQKEEEHAPYLWIDQICIDQSNVAERSSQVQFMGRIYKRGVHVITWLGDGPTSSSTEACYDAARRFSEERSIEDLAVILKHEYFTRLWVVQEIILAQSIRVLVGNVWISWHDMEQVGKSHNNIIRDYTLARTLAEDPRGPRMTWKFWLYYAFGKAMSHSKCADPRDKVYGMLGVVKGGKHTIAIDYSKSVYEVYADLVVAVYSTFFDPNYVTRGDKTEIYLNAFETLFMSMGGQESHWKTFERFFIAIWDEERRLTFRESPVPITRVGFDHASEGIAEDRWWYDFVGTRYYVECNSSEWTLEHHRPLLVDWKEYLPLEDDGIAE